MSITLAANITSTPTPYSAGSPVCELNIQIGDGEGSSQSGFISARMAYSLISALTAGSCTLTLSQP